jgi:hypothetical protein
MLRREIRRIDAGTRPEGVGIALGRVLAGWAEAFQGSIALNPPSEARRFPVRCGGSWLAPPTLAELV